MPPPTETSSGDPMAMLYELISKQRNNDMTSGKANVDHNRQLEKAEQLKEQAAFKKQEDAQNSANTWGIFGKIASVVAIAASGVAAVCSCGAASGLCIGACILSTVAFAESETHVLTQLTGNPDVDKAFQIGCGIGAALCSGGAGIATLGSSVLVGASEIVSSGCKVGQETLGAVDDKGCQDASMAFGIGGAAAGVVGSLGSVGNVAAASSNTAKSIAKATADVVEGAGEVGSGMASIGTSQYEADATDRGADAKQAQMAIDRLQTLTNWLVDGIQETDKSHERALSTLSGAMQTKAQTLVIASAKV